MIIRRPSRRPMRFTPGINEWNPGMLQNNLAWYRADKFIGQSNGLINSWGNIISNDLALTQSVDANKPSFVENSVLYRGPVLNFTGIGGGVYKTLLSRTGIAMAQPLTIYFVGHPNSVAAASVLVDGSISSRVMIYSSTAGKVALYAGTDVVGAAAGVISTTPACWCVTFGATDTVYYNDFVTSKATGDAGSNALSQIVLGIATPAPAANPWHGYVSETLIRVGNDDLQTRMLIRQYFANRYRI